MLKIKWECIPSVFTHAAKDGNGDVCIYGVEPERGDSCWVYCNSAYSHRVLISEEYEDTGTEWADSLTTRAEWEAGLWESAPAKTVCHATDADGKSYWYSTVPDMSGSKFEAPGCYVQADCCFSRLENWKDSLRRRPEVVKKSVPEPTKPVTMTITIDGYTYPISVECIIQSVKDYLEKQKREMS